MDANRILSEFPERRTKNQKRQFRAAVLSYVRSLGYSAYVETGAFRTRNVIIGNPNTADYLITAHYDTCRMLPLKSGLYPCSRVGILAFILWRLILILIIPSILSAITLYFGIIWVEISVFSAALLAEIGAMVLFRINPFAMFRGDSGILTLLNLAEGLQRLHRKKVCFVLFDGKQTGFIGSYSYRKLHPDGFKRQICLDFNDVSAGDQIYLFPGKGMRADPDMKKKLKALSGYYGKKLMYCPSRGFCVSDYLLFPYGVGICSADKRIRNLFLKRNRRKNAPKDQTNVNLLHAAILSFCSCNAVK